VLCHHHHHLYCRRRRLLLLLPPIQQQRLSCDYNKNKNNNAGAIPYPFRNKEQDQFPQKTISFLFVGPIWAGFHSCTTCCCLWEFGERERSNHEFPSSSSICWGIEPQFFTKFVCKRQHCKDVNTPTRLNTHSNFNLWFENAKNLFRYECNIWKLFFINVPPSEMIFTSSWEYGQSLKQRALLNDKCMWRFFNRCFNTKYVNVILKLFTRFMNFALLNNKVLLMKTNHKKWNDYLHIIFSRKMNRIPTIHIVFLNTLMFESRIQHYGKHFMNLICIISFQKN